MAQQPMTPQQMQEMAQYLRTKGMTEEQIEQVLGGDESEFAAAREKYRMSAIPATAALKGDSKNIFGAGGDFLSGYIANRDKKEFDEFNKQWKLGNITRRKTQIDMLDPARMMRNDPGMAAQRASLGGLQALAGEEAGGLPGLAAALGGDEEDPEEKLRRLTGG